MLKFACRVSCAVVLLFPSLTLASGTRIICEGQTIGKCFRKVGARPVAQPDCPTKKGWLIEEIPNCRRPVPRPNQEPRGTLEDKKAEVEEDN